MNKFPSFLEVKNKENFKEIYLEKIICNVRSDICIYMLQRDHENTYWDLDKFNLKHLKDMDKLKKIVDKIVDELIALGWKCKYSFGSTALFIYSSKNPPPSCWEDGL